MENLVNLAVFIDDILLFSYRRAANAARAMAALTSSSMSGVFPPIAAAMPLIPPMATVPPIIPTKGWFILKSFQFK